MAQFPSPDEIPPRTDPRWPGLELKPDPSCSRRLNWRVHLPDGPTLDVLVQRLLDGGVFCDPRCHLGTWLLESLHGHQCVMVPATRRIQLRIHPTMEHAHRAETAWLLALQIAHAYAGG